MKFLNKLIGGNVLLKVTSMNSISVIAQMLCGFIISKTIAVFVGPSGMTLIGNLRNFLGVTQQLGVLGMYNGVVKYTAEFKDQDGELKRLFSTSFFIGCVSTVITALVLFFGAPYFSNLIFENKGYESVIRALAIALPFYSLNLFCLGIINGFSKYKAYVSLTITTTILGMLVTVLLIYMHSLTGALYAIVLVPALHFLATLVLIFKERSFVGFLKLNFVSKPYIKKLSSFAGMTLVSALTLPLVMIAIRSEIVDVESTTEAGYWEAMNRISNYYMMFFTTLMTLYILPQLASTNSNKAFRTEIFNFYKKVVPLFIVGMIIIFFFRNFIIPLVLSSEFMPMQSLFIWQLLGDIFKIISVVIAYQMIAKNMFWAFIITELISTAVIYLSSVYFVNSYGFVGASIGHFVSYVFYFVMMLFVFRKALFSNIEN